MSNAAKIRSGKPDDRRKSEAMTVKKINSTASIARRTGQERRRRSPMAVFANKSSASTFFLELSCMQAASNRILSRHGCP